MFLIIFVNVLNKHSEEQVFYNKENMCLSGNWKLYEKVTRNPVKTSQDAGRIYWKISD